MLLNTFSCNKKNEKIVNNQDGGLKLPLFDLKPSECNVRCQNLIGSYASTHSAFNLIGSCNTNPNTQSHKDTYTQITDMLYELFFQNSSKTDQRNRSCYLLLQLNLSLGFQ